MVRSKTVAGTFVAMALAVACVVTGALNVLVTSASAAENPGWRACEEAAGTGTKFKDSACTETSLTGKFEEIHFATSAETRELLVESSGKNKLSVAGGAVVIACKKLGVTKGSNAVGGEPGVFEGRIEYGECEVEKHLKCKIDGLEGGKAKITTNALKGTFVYLSKEAAEKHEAEKTGVFFQAASGKALLTASLEGECPVTGEFTIEGQLVAEAPEAAKRKSVHPIKAPAKAIKAYWTNEAGKAVEKKVTGLSAGGMEAILEIEGSIWILPRSGPNVHLLFWVGIE